VRSERGAPVRRAVDDDEDVRLRGRAVAGEDVDVIGPCGADRHCARGSERRDGEAAECGVQTRKGFHQRLLWGSHVQLFWTWVWLWRSETPCRTVTEAPVTASVVLAVISQTLS